MDLSSGFGLQFKNVMLLVTHFYFEEGNLGGSEGGHGTRLTDQVGEGTRYRRITKGRGLRDLFVQLIGRLFLSYLYLLYCLSVWNECYGLCKVFCTFFVFDWFDSRTAP